MSDDNNDKYDHAAEWERVKNHGMSNNHEVISHAAASDTISTKRVQQMSDSLDHDNARLEQAAKYGDKAEAAKVAARLDKNSANYIIENAKADSARAAGAPARARKDIAAGSDNFPELSINNRKYVDKNVKIDPRDKAKP